jgi:hypothetical protein
MTARRFPPLAVRATFWAVVGSGGVITADRSSARTAHSSQIWPRFAYCSRTLSSSAVRARSKQFFSPYLRHSIGLGPSTMAPVSPSVTLHCRRADKPQFQGLNFTAQCQNQADAPSYSCSSNSPGPRHSERCDRCGHRRKSWWQGRRSICTWRVRSRSRS